MRFVVAKSAADLAAHERRFGWLDSPAKPDFLLGLTRERRCLPLVRQTRRIAAPVAR